MIHLISLLSDHWLGISLSSVGLAFLIRLACLPARLSTAVHPGDLEP